MSEKADDCWETVTADEKAGLQTENGTKLGSVTLGCETWWKAPPSVGPWACYVELFGL